MTLRGRCIAPQSTVYMVMRGMALYDMSWSLSLQHSMALYGHYFELNDSLWSRLSSCGMWDTRQVVQSAEEAASRRL